MAPMTRRFVNELERYAQREGVDLIRFERGERKDERTRAYLRHWHGGEGVPTSARRRNAPGWCAPSAAMTRSPAPPERGQPLSTWSTDWSVVREVLLLAMCVNGHEYLKRQLTQRGIGFEALDNGIVRCDAPDAMQAIAEEVTAPRIDALLRKWLARLPHPFTGADRAEHIRYELSILQAEFALTQVFDRPAQGRVFFEEVMRENLDLGRPDHVQLIFNRRVTKRTPSRYRTRVITDGVSPSLHVDYKHSRIKQYHKEGRALRTETVVNNTYDFAIGRRLSNLDDLQKVGFSANRRLLRVQQLSHDCPLGVQTFEELHRPTVVEDRRVSALRFGDPRVQALLAVLLTFRLLPMGFANRELRTHVATLLGVSADAYGSTRATYDLRRLRLRGLVERIPRSHRYRVTEAGQRVALCYCRGQRRILGPTLSAVFDDAIPPALGRLVKRFDDHINRLWQGQPLAA